MTSKKSRSIYDEYFEYDTTYKTKYGDKTCVLLEVGSFFEIYTYKIISTNTIQHNQTQEISRICNLSLVEKKANYKNNDQQIMMMGFRNYMLDKYLQKLVDIDYTVVVFTQDKNEKGVTRKLDAVYSRGTYLRSDEDNDISSNTGSSQYIVCIWLESYTTLIKKTTRTKKLSTILSSSSTTPPIQKVIYGISAVNIFTGHSSIFEYETPLIMNPTTFDEMERFLSTFDPSEVVVVSNTMDEKTIRTILRFAGVQCNTIHVFSKDIIHSTTPTSITEKVHNCEKQTYIQTILSLYYDNPNIFLQNDDFNRNPIATQSLCFLMDFIKEHNHNLIRKISIPTFTNTSNRMVLANHTLRQLNIINDMSNDGGSVAGIFSSVLSFMNKCNTSIGRRVFRRLLLTPTIDSNWLEEEYSKIENILKMYDPNQINNIRKRLGQMRDIEKIYRQIVTKKISPSSIYQLYNTIDILESLQVETLETVETFEMNTKTSFLPQHFKEFLNNHFEIDICRDINTIQTFGQNIIRIGINEIIDKLIIQKNIYSNQLTTIYQYFNQLFSKEKTNNIRSDDTGELIDYIKIHDTDKSGFSFQITKKRANVLKKILSTLENEGTSKLIIPFDNITIDIPINEIKIVSSTSSNDEINIPFLSNLSHKILKNQEELNIIIYQEYLTIIETIEHDWSEHLTHFIHYIGNMDVLITKSYIAREYHYCRPVIVNESPKSFLKSKKMRHPLIEHIQTNEIYVPNDIELGIGCTDGILLFGTNAIGKTSLIRSIGVCVILAQAGFYVPCESFEYKPYTSLFSRIIGNDNLFKNLSTFQVEISELSVILKQADKNSLILGDEICSSTELESGLSIIMASLIEFHNRQSSFIFATHFHEIVRWKEMTELTNIAIKHLEVSFDVTTGKLIYDRKLKEGMGISSYGLTVCKSMNLPTDFIDRAFEIRNSHYPEKSGILSFPSSKYNTSKIRGMCENCNNEISSEIHHIQPQKNADLTGFIRNDEGQIFHKNHQANLKSLCEKCHKNAHK